MISENCKLGNSVRKKWRTAVPLWPDCAQKAPPGRPGACPRVPRELHGSAKASLIVEEKWTQAKNMVCLSNLSSKNKNISENDALANALGHMWRTYQPLWSTWAWRARPGRPGERPGAPRERPGGTKKSYSRLVNGRTSKIKKIIQKT